MSTGKPRPVRSLTTNTVYPSARQAAIATGTDPGSIRRAILGQVPRAGGHRWAYAAQEQPHPRARPVILDDGRHFESVRAAAIAIGVPDGNLHQSLRNGWRCRGHRVRWADKAPPPDWSTQAPSTTGGDRYVE
jgi:hypothetical protein